MNSDLLKKRCLAEFIGTFVIVFAPVALGSTGKLSGGESGLMAAAWASGLSVTAMIYALGPISAAHFNPAVTLGFALAGRFPRSAILPYWASQFGGGVCAAGVCALLFGGGAGTHSPGNSIFAAFGIEIIISFVLMLVIMAVATDKRTNGAVPGLSIGLTVVLNVLIAGSVSGGSMNPARSLGPLLFAGGRNLSVYWIYFFAPILGCILAARVYELLRVEPQYAQNAPVTEASSL